MNLSLVLRPTLALWICIADSQRVRNPPGLSCRGLCPRSLAGALAVTCGPAVALKVVHMLAVVLVTSIPQATHAQGPPPSPDIQPKHRCCMDHNSLKESQCGELQPTKDERW